MCPWCAAGVPTYGGAAQAQATAASFAAGQVAGLISYAARMLQASLSLFKILIQLPIIAGKLTGLSLV